jgi:hypothetical protein
LSSFTPLPATTAAAPDLPNAAASSSPPADGALDQRTGRRSRRAARRARESPSGPTTPERRTQDAPQRLVDERRAFELVGAEPPHLARARRPTPERA